MSQNVGFLSLSLCTISVYLTGALQVYAAGSPIIPSTGWNPAADGASQKSWFTALAPSVSLIIYSHRSVNILPDLPAVP